MKPEKTLPQRMARYMAAVLLIAGVAVIMLVAVSAEVPLNTLWQPLFWGGLGCLLLGWAVGHAAGRLIAEVRETEKTRPVSHAKDSPMSEMIQSMNENGIDNKTADTQNTA